MYIVYAKMNKVDVKNYSGIIKEHEQEEFSTKSEAMDYVGFLKVFSDKNFRVRIDELINDDMKTIFDKDIR